MKIRGLLIISIFLILISYSVSSIIISSFINTRIEGDIKIIGKTQSKLYIGSEIENNINLWLINWSLAEMNNNMVITNPINNLSVGNFFETVYLIKNEGNYPFLINFSIYDDWFNDMSSKYYGFTYGIKKLDMNNYFTQMHHNINSIINVSHFWYDITDSSVFLNSSSSSVDYTEYLCFKIWYSADNLMVEPDNDIHTIVFINATILDVYTPYIQIDYKPAEQNDFISYWSFDEGTGLIAHDYSQNNHNGTITNGVWVSGVSEHGISFDGTGKIEIEEINLGDSWSLLFWINLDSQRSTATQIIGWGGSSGYPGYAASIWNKTSDVKTAVGGSFGSVRCQSNSKAYYNWIDNWNHVAIICNNGIITYYINGIEKTDDSSYGLCGLFVNRICGFGDTLHWMDGSLDEMMIFNKPISYDNIMYYYSIPSI